jgi:tetratricopeptide (TPR) repeat protein
VDDDATRRELPPETPEPLRGPEPARRRRGDLVGRYVVLDQLGEGAMGVVYRAYDPELDRRVALKFLLARREGLETTHAARARIQREAQAMARISHPNVIAIHDVGIHDGEVFIAMELVDGMPLSEWIARQREAPSATTARGWKRVRDVFLAAGRGLAAAHAAGLIHRDFKPANVLVGHDGRVCVLDFGLARSEAQDEREITAPPGSTGEFRRSEVASDLTVAGTVMGTPAYMAPEQHRAEPIDARADQYAFCVALYEALCGRRPFAGATAREQYAAKCAPLSPFPASTPVPPWVFDLLRRGLSLDPAQRFLSMDVLLRRLARRPTRRSPARLLAIGGGVGVVGGTALALFMVAGAPPACPGAEARLRGVWDGEVRDRVAAAFETSGVVYARGAFAALRERLDAYAEAWGQAHDRTCSPPAGGDPRALHAFGVRRACLDRRLAELAAWTELLVQADARIVELSITDGHQLVPVDRCERPGAGLEPELPGDPEQRAEMATLRSRLTGAAASLAAGRFDEARVAADRVARDADAFLPVRAEALHVRASAELAAGDPAAAEASLHASAWAATASGHRVAAARAFVALLRLSPGTAADPTQVDRLAGLADAAVTAAGDEPRLTAELADAKAQVALARGRPSDAVLLRREALAILESLHRPDDPRVADALDALGLDLLAAGDPAPARAAFERALSVRRAAFGDEHPSVAAAQRRLGDARLR